jgi:hypothetical protein
MTKIMTITLSHMDLKKIELLDCGQNNWEVWSAKMCNHLLLKHGGGYIPGVIACLDETLDPVSTGTWDLNAKSVYHYSIDHLFMCRRTGLSPPIH